MIKNLMQFKSVIQEIESTFHFEQNCPIPIAKEALLECLKWIGQVEDIAKANAATKDAEEKQADQLAEESSQKTAPEVQQE